MQTHVKRKINGRTLMVTVAKAKAMDRARKIAVSGKGNAAYQKQILQLQSEVERLENAPLAILPGADGRTQSQRPCA
ncbi:hypothetical protein [Mesorhizobium sp. M1163]|uniref:hypothetical protein n=1 Tax=Mesorhizobium sp. M1163 TaxID=2957065 RepID=UPI00333CA378